MVTYQTYDVYVGPDHIVEVYRSGDRTFAQVYEGPREPEPAAQPITLPLNSRANVYKRGFFACVFVAAAVAAVFLVLSN